MTLYEISATMQQFLAAVDAGEIPEEAFADTLEGLEGLLADKLDDCACAYKGLIAEAKEIKAEEAALAARRKVKENEAARLASYIDHCLRDSAGEGVKPEKFETARNVLSYRASEAVDVPDVESVVKWIHSHDGVEVGGVTVKQNELLNFKLPDLSKTALKAALKAGLVIPGATVKRSFNLQIK
ncbi:siphovirus Gp157 family protein [Gemmiger formicilis]|uniref:siphovirus Gp157 family protein n=1 Tax=Gemmiger formicilis TaxID=745368 RepID=UPI003CCB360A